MFNHTRQCIVDCEPIYLTPVLESDIDLCCKWVNDPEGTRKMVEELTRPTIGTEESPIPGIPNQKTSHR